METGRYIARIGYVIPDDIKELDPAKPPPVYVSPNRADYFDFITAFPRPDGTTGYETKRMPLAPFTTTPLVNPEYEQWKKNVEKYFKLIPGVIHSVVRQNGKLYLTIFQNQIQQQAFEAARGASLVKHLTEDEKSTIWAQARKV